MANKQVRNVMKFYIVVLQTCTVWNPSIDIIQFMNTCIFGQSFVKSFGVSDSEKRLCGWSLDHSRDACTYRHLDLF